MKTIEQKQQATIQATDDTAQAGKAGIIVTIMAAGCMGVWGTTCLMSGLATNGIGDIVTGFMTAITGM
jgi:hypothetical protein